MIDMSATVDGIVLSDYGDDIKMAILEGITGTNQNSIDVDQLCADSADDISIVENTQNIVSRTDDLYEKYREIYFRSRRGTTEIADLILGEEFVEEIEEDEEFFEEVLNNG